MTRAAFLDWDGHEDGRYEFDGVRPVPMAREALNHSRIVGNIAFALHTRLRGTGMFALGPEVGLATTGSAVRYPDVLVAQSGQIGTSKLATGAVAVFEVVSPTSSRTDRITKVAEYRAVPAIRRYVIVEGTSVALRAHHSQSANADWTVTLLVVGEVLALPELGIEVPLAEIYEGTGVPETAPDDDH